MWHVQHVISSCCWAVLLVVEVEVGVRAVHHLAQSRQALLQQQQQ
jgi:hypothetical protein